MMGKPEIKTPYYIAHPKRIAENYRLMSKALPVDRLYYATKANGEALTLKALIAEGAGFEVVCADEMEYFLSLGVSAEDMICSRPIKTAEEISRMYALGCRYFVYDSESQYELLREYSPGAKKIVRLNMRFVSPHDLVFGLYPEEIADMAKRGILPDGYTFYIFERDNWPEKLDGVFDALEKLISARGDTAPLILNLGGHYVLPGEDTQGALEKLRERVAQLKAACPGLTVYAEPGGCIVKSAYDMVTSVTETRNADWVFIDTDANQIRGSVCIEPYDEIEKCSARPLYFLDSLCSGNIVAVQDADYAPKKGDRLIIRSVGAYSICFSNSFHWVGKPQTVVEENDTDIQ